MIISENLSSELSDKRLKVLHLTFHRGCLNSFESVAQELNLDVESWYIPDLPQKFLDGVSPNSALFNIGHDRAKRIWDLHKEEFEKFDVIFTSDTAPLARIFLQNGWEKPLIVWICNRFDYTDEANLEFYALFNRAASQSNVTIVCNTEFEHIYARAKGVNLGSLVIKPFLRVKTDEIAYDIKDLFYLPAYHNETIFMNLSSFCSQRGIENYGGRHNGLDDLKTYKGIIHLPYAWSTIALFENISIGIPYFLPSKRFLKKLMASNNYWHQNSRYLTKHNMYQISEWYDQDNSKIMTYFDSWNDLQKKVGTLDFLAQRKKILEFAKWHQETMITRWKNVFEKVQAK